MSRRDEAPSHSTDTSASNWRSPTPGQAARGAGADSAGQRPTAWELIERLEDVRRELFAAERQANADTRWWLLVPMLLIAVVMGVVALGGVYVPLDAGRYYGWMSLGIAALGVLVGAQVWLGNRMLLPRRTGLPHRRELRRRVEQLKRQLSQQCSSTPTDVARAPVQPAAELIGELECTRRNVIEVNDRAIANYRWRYLVASSLMAFPIGSVIIFGIWFPLDTGRFYGLLVAAVPLLGLLVWAFVRFGRKFGESWIIAGPRWRELKRMVERLEKELVRGYGKEALRRQPTVRAEAGWKRYPSLGPPPAVVLQRLPEGTSRFRLWFHRHLGWGATAILGLCVLLLVGYSFLR